LDKIIRAKTTITTVTTGTCCIKKI